MSAEAPLRPKQISPFPNGEIGIIWEDGHESYLDGHALRCACTCATCVDEMSGKKVLRDETVPRDVKIRELHPVGNYGVSVAWTDGHDSGIYTFEHLRELSESLGEE